MLSSLFISQTVNTIAKALDPVQAIHGPVAVLGQVRIGRALAERGHRILFISDKAKSLRRLKGERLCSQLDDLPLAEHRLAGLVAFGIRQRSDWSQVMSEWRRTVADGGAIVLVDRGPATELTRCALCSGLTEIEQRHVGRTVITSGLLALYD